MLFRVLGPLVVEGAGGQVRLGGRPRMLLAALLVELGQVVPTGRLVDILWAGSPPDGASVTLRSHIHHLRRAFETAEPGASIAVATMDGGYRLAVAPDQVDARRFRVMVRSGRSALDAGDPAVAAEILRSALDLWHGSTAFQDMADRPFLLRYAAELASLREAAVEVRIDADLAIGRHAELLGELRIRAAHSFDEVAWTRLALALYRSHRVDSAARACREGLGRLSERSLEAPALRELQQAILRRDSSLDWAPVSAGAPARPDSASRPTSVRPHPAPRQLPPPLALFTGRRQELDQLDSMLPGGGGGTVVLTGMAGMGKTALALSWLRRRATELRADHLYADMRGCEQRGPATAHRTLGIFLRALGTPPERVPDTLDERTGLYRSLTAERPVLVLADDAASAAQVRPLAPGCAEGVLLVTSRHRLDGLLVDGARLLPLGPMAPDDCAELFVRIAGDDLRSERTAIAALVTRCGGLPLALCLAGARIAAGAGRTRIEDIVDALGADATGALETLSVEDVSVRDAFDRSYLKLPEQAARVYRRAVLLPGTDFDGAVVAAGAGVSVDTASRLLGHLLDASLLNASVPEGSGPRLDRYAFHALARVHAEVRADEDDSPAEREIAVLRAVDWYLACADAADRIVMPRRRRSERAYTFAAPRPPSFAGPAHALAWLETERWNLLAVARLAYGRGWHSAVWHLVDAMWSLFLYRKHYQQWVESHQIGIGAARAGGEADGETMLLNHLGLAYHGLARFENALECFQQALVGHRAVGDRRGEATALNSSGLALRGLGRDAEAVGSFTHAVVLQRDVADIRGEALTRANLGRAYADTGHLAEAVRHLGSARVAFTRLEDHYNEARTLRGLAGVLIQAGRTNSAVRRLEPALEVMRELGSGFEHAQILETVGDAARRLGDRRAARRRYEQALVLYQEVNGPHGERLRRRLDLTGRR